MKVKNKIPDGWQNYKLEEILEFKNGINTDKESYGSGIPFVNVMDVFASNSLKAADIRGRVSLDKKRVADNLVVRGDILFNRTSEVEDEIAYSTVYLDDEPIVFGGFVIKGHPTGDHLCDQYKKYCFFASYVRREMIRRSQGAVRSNIGQNDMSEVELLVPPLKEQKAIADVLAVWDLAIEKTERLIAAKEKKFKWLLNELINKPASAPDAQEKGWRKVRLGDVCNAVTRKNSSGDDNVLTSSAQNGLISQKEYYNKYVSAEDVSGYYLLKRGEFAYNRSSAQGYPYGAIKRLDKYDSGVLSTLYLCFSICGELTCHSDFLLYLFESKVLNKLLRKVCQEGARSHGLLNITKDDFFNLYLFLPSFDLQKKIAQAIKRAEEEIFLLKKIEVEYKKQKQGLMQKLLTGQWRVNCGG